MGLYPYGAQCCNNCWHWQCHAKRSIRGNPPKEIYTDSNCDKCSRTGRSTLSKDCCSGFLHLDGATNTFQQGKEPDLAQDYINALLAFTQESRQAIIVPSRSASQASNETNAEDYDNLDGEEEHEFARTMQELGKANERVSELLDEGLAPKYALKDEAVEFMHMLDRARSGDAMSQFRFAKALWEGAHGALGMEGLVAFYKTHLPVNWCTEAANQGLSEAQYYLAHRNCCGKAETIKWFRRAAEQGHRKAQIELAELADNLAGDARRLLGECINQLQSGDNVNRVIKNIELASVSLNHGGDVIPLYEIDDNFVATFVSLIGRWDKDGAPELQNALGMMYAAYSSYKNIVQKDYVTAVDWFVRAANGGCADAMDNLGNCYAEGCGVDKDEAVASEWYRKAAEKDLASGQYHYACRLISGYGIEKDMKLARELLHKAIEQGISEARDCLDILESECDETDPRLALRAGWALHRKHEYAAAVKCFNKAQRSGLAEARFALGECYADGCGVGKDKALAVGWFLLAARQGFPRAQYRLAVHIGYGEESSGDKELAFAWYLRAAKNGYAKAMYSVGVCYIEGDGVVKDVELGAAWKERAKANGYEPQRSSGW